MNTKNTPVMARNFICRAMCSEFVWDVPCKDCRFIDSTWGEFSIRVGFSYPDEDENEELEQCFINEPGRNSSPKNICNHSTNASNVTPNTGKRQSFSPRKPN